MAEVRAEKSWAIRFVGANCRLKLCCKRNNISFIVKNAVTRLTPKPLLFLVVLLSSDSEEAWAIFYSPLAGFRLSVQPNIQVIINCQRFFVVFAEFYASPYNY
jgi:hypothetical protein